MNFTTKGSAFYATFLRPKKEWRRPTRAKILIYDVVGAEVLEPFVSTYTYTTMAIRGEAINVPSLLLAMLDLRFWKGDALISYIDSYIAMVAPKIIITFIDNDVRFYGISKRFPNIKTIFVQNGRRAELGDIFGSLKRKDEYQVDYMLVFGQAVGKMYSSYISGKVIPIGSIKNNSVPRSETHTNDNVLYISTWGSKPKNDAPYLIKDDGTPISWETYFSIEKQVFEFLDRWCLQNGKTLLICGRIGTDYSEEKAFYADKIKQSKWEFIPWGNIHSTYHQMNSAEIVVFIESTCGYESLSRGKRTAAFACRGMVASNVSESFGWPADLPSNGPFWTNDLDANRFQEIMDFLEQSENDEWQTISSTYSHEIMDFDYGNSRLVALISSLLD